MGAHTRATRLLDRNVGRHSRLALHVDDHVRVVLAERCDAVAELLGDLRQALGAVADQQTPMGVSFRAGGEAGVGKEFVRKTGSGGGRVGRRCQNQAAPTSCLA
jgi:hypothetical protein